jgi:hypothetical protein
VADGPLGVFINVYVQPMYTMPTVRQVNRNMVSPWPLGTIGPDPTIGKYRICCKPDMVCSSPGCSNQDIMIPNAIQELYECCLDMKEIPPPK